MASEDTDSRDSGDAIEVQSGTPPDLSGVVTKRKTISRLSLALMAMALVALSGIGWLASDRHRSAAEKEAREELNQLGALVIMGANQKHVQGVNLSLPAVREQLDRAMELLPKLPYLEVLTLSDTLVSDRQMARVTPCRNLTSLVLKNTALGDATLEHLAPLHQLQTLYLHQTKITTAGLNRIGRLTSLRILDLSKTTIRGDLAELSPLKNLQHLLLRGVALSDDAVETLCQLQSLSRLSVDNGQLNDQAIAKLRKAKPGIQIDGAEVR